MIQLNYRDARPIYLQVKDGLRHLVVTGAIQQGDQFPSVRALAASLAINPNTIQRAYEALEKEGYLRAEAGRGVFAAKGMGGTGERRETLLKQLDETVNELLFLGMTPQELAARVSAAGTKGEEET
ncbi:GntR family transcriptional regulator [Intestinimonas butyriciproducens]|uniref:GntR family transcriptional regulator n=1 Tax=Candidatus Intestinimonas merdavium TaxID=2838622 RepID=A0A9D1Z3A1_9FIRM|nr:GntR family transcriptional regulator [Intestinimonas butyriciproducens]HIY72592.1 GntR family transcriptional regulator [Candidatus Intestinimonas merdavium]